jgi:plastocyanin
MKARAATALALTAGVAVGVPTAGIAAGSATAPVKVTVTAKEFSFKLSVRKLPVGKPIALTLVNKGAAPHDFSLQGVKKTKILGPGQKQTVRFTIKRKGTYRYVCTVPRHAQFGMEGDIKAG